MTSAMFGRSGAGGSRPRADTATDAEPLSDECRRVQTAQRILSARRLRYVHLSEALFGEPAWDMLLQIYVRETSGLSSTIKELQGELEQPASTTARWIRVLEEQALVRRKRLSIGMTEVVELTQKGRTALNAYLTAVQEL